MMKKIFGIIALLLIVAACNTMEIDNHSVEQNRLITITAQLAPKTADTKAVDDGGDHITVTWAKNEHIAILYEVSSTKYVADAEITAVDGSGKATISFSVDGSTPDNTPCTLVYPLSAAKDDNSGVKDAATLLAAQNGTLNANLDVRVGAGIIQTTTPSLTVTTEPVAQFSIFKFTIKNAAGDANVNVKPFNINIGAQTYVITPASATTTLYAALPAVSNKTVYFSAIGSDSKTYIFSKDNVTFNAGKYYQSTLKMTKVDGLLSGIFAINSSGGRVYFSQGNLQATCSSADDDGSTRETWTWHFAEHQWDYIGNKVANNRINGNGSVSDAGTVDIFGWSTAATYYGIHNSTTASDYSGDFIDWGANIGTGWHTLTKDEWLYVFNSRPGSTVNGTSHSRYTQATINTDGTGVKGVILFPDGVNFASSEFENLNAINGSSQWGTNCTTEQWAALAAKGCVFLPAAGQRGSSIYGVGSQGRYWSSTLNSATQSRGIFFYDWQISPDGYTDRHYASSVRLVYVVH